MRKIIVLVSAIIALIISSLSAVGWSSALAQDAPPGLGDVILEDSLSAPGSAVAYTCPSGRVKREFANDGLTLTISGGCQDPAGFAGTGIDAGNRLTIADGEVRADFRQLSGADRTQVQVFLRTSNSASGFSGYSAQLNPTRGTVQLGVSVNGQYKQLGQRTDLATMLRPDDWNTLAFRAQGPNLWAFVNGTMVLAATDGSLDAGIANVVVNRTGQPSAEDTQEVSGVLRNLKVSAIAGGEQARRPVYTPPPPVVAASALPCTQPTAVANDVKMTPPPDGTDSSIAKLAGAWEGVWEPDSGNPLPSRLYVEQFDGAKVIVVYTWGDAPNFNTRAGWQRHAADVLPDGKIGWGTTIRFTFWAVDDKVEGLRETAQNTSKVTFSRCP